MLLCCGRSCRGQADTAVQSAAPRTKSGDQDNAALPMPVAGAGGSCQMVGRDQPQGAPADCPRCRGWCRQVQHRWQNRRMRPVTGPSVQPLWPVPLRNSPRSGQRGNFSARTRPCQCRLSKALDWRGDHLVIDLCRILAAAVARLPHFETKGFDFVSLADGLTRDRAANPHDVMHRLTKNRRERICPAGAVFPEIPKVTAHLAGTIGDARYL